MPLQNGWSGILVIFLANDICCSIFKFLILLGYSIHLKIQIIYLNRYNHLLLDIILSL